MPGLTVVCLPSDESELLLIGGSEAVGEHRTLLV